MTTTLIVDDESDMRVLVGLVLEMAGDDLEVVAEAADGGDAVRVWRALPAPSPDVVIIDNRMPVMTGLEAAREILEEDPSQIVVLYSAFLDESIRAEAGALGISACISKRDLESLPNLLRELTSGSGLDGAP